VVSPVVPFEFAGCEEFMVVLSVWVGAELEVVELGEEVFEGEPVIETTPVEATEVD